MEAAEGVVLLQHMGPRLSPGDGGWQKVVDTCGAHPDSQSAHPCPSCSQLPLVWGVALLP